jgi:P4 family phage/plasmid primase-like protien
MDDATLQVNLGLLGSKLVGKQFYGARQWSALDDVPALVGARSLLIPEVRGGGGGGGGDGPHVRFLGALDIDFWDDAVLARVKAGELELIVDAPLVVADRSKVRSADLTRHLGGYARTQKLGVRELLDRVPLLGALWRRLERVCARLRAANVVHAVYYSGAKGFRLLVHASELFCAVAPGAANYHADAERRLLAYFVDVVRCERAEVDGLFDASIFGPEKGTRPDLFAHPESRLWPSGLDRVAPLDAEDAAVSQHFRAFVAWFVGAARAAWALRAELPRLAPAAQRKRAAAAPADAAAAVKRGKAQLAVAAGGAAAVSEPLFEHPKAAAGAATHFSLKAKYTSYRRVDNVAHFYDQLAVFAGPHFTSECMSAVTRLAIDYDAGPPLREPCAVLGGATPLAAIMRVVAERIFVQAPSAHELRCVVVETPRRAADAPNVARAKIYFPALFVTPRDGSAAMATLADALADLANAAEPDEGAAAASENEADASSGNEADGDGDDHDDGGDGAVGPESDMRDAPNDDDDDENNNGDDGYDESSSSDDDAMLGAAPIGANDGADASDIDVDAADAAIEWRIVIDAQIYAKGALRMAVSDVYDEATGRAQGRAHVFDARRQIEFSGVDALPMPDAQRRCRNVRALLDETSLREQSRRDPAGWTPRVLAPEAAARRGRAPPAADRGADGVLPAELCDALAAEMRADVLAAPLFALEGGLTVLKRLGGRLYAYSTQRGCPNAPERDGVRAHASRTLFVALAIEDGCAVPALRCTCTCERAPRCADWRVVCAPLSRDLSRRLYPDLAALHLDEAHEQLPLADVERFLADAQRGDARLLARLFAGRVCYDALEKTYYAWAGNRWIADDAGLVTHVLSAAAAHQYRSAARLLRRDANRALVARDVGVDDAGSANDANDAADVNDAAAEAARKKLAKSLAGRIKALEGRAHNVSTFNHIKNVLKFLEPLVRVPNERWDAQPYLLFCRNCVVDLRPDAVPRARAAVPSDYNRSVAPVDFRGDDAAAPRFAAALRDIFHYPAAKVAREAAEALERDDAAGADCFVARARQIGASVGGNDGACATAAAAFARDGALDAFEAAFAAALPAQPGEAELFFVQEALGASLVGTVLGEHLFVHYGADGANAKSWLFELVADVLGPDIARPVPVETLLATGQSSAGPSPHVLMLRGTRLVWCSELESGTSLSAAKIKRLTGGDTVAARGLYQDIVTFKPSHTLHVVTNHLIAAPGDDVALWRRIVVVEYKNRFVAEPSRANERRADASLRACILDEEPSGVLAWLVAGCARYLARNGRLNVPASARALTQQYEHASRAGGVARFVAARCSVAPAARVEGAPLRAAYEAWHAAQYDDGERLAPQAFAHAICALPGVARALKRGVVVYVGLALCAEAACGGGGGGGDGGGDDGGDGGGGGGEVCDAGDSGESDAGGGEGAESNGSAAEM